MNTVKKCQTTASENAFELLFNRLNGHLAVLEKEIADAREYRECLVEIVISFSPPQLTMSVNTGR